MPTLSQLSVTINLQYFSVSIHNFVTLILTLPAIVYLGTSILGATGNVANLEKYRHQKVTIRDTNRSVLMSI